MRLNRVLSGYVERKEMPGLVALVSHRDNVHVEAVGTMSFGDSRPMTRDSIFRIASLSKPIVAAAAMILVEDCRLRLDESIERWIPELANRRVLRSIGSELDDTVPARRAITVRDVLTYRMGFGSVMAAPGTCPIQKAIRDLKIGGDGPSLPAESPAPDEWLRRLGSLPWLAQPGERWMYHVSGDVLGVLIARVSRQSLGEFLRERIFDPLGMVDTGFWVPPEKLARLPEIYFFNRETNAVDVFDMGGSWSGPPPFESGAGGLVATVDDQFKFCRMMLDGGQKILSRASVSLMTSDQVTAEQRAGSELFFGDYSSWGFGMQVDIARREIYHSPGRFGWAGGFGTTAYSDPAQGVIGILFTQRMMDSPEPPKVFSDFWTLAYGTL